MDKSTSMNIRIDPRVKAEAEAVYSRYGLSLFERTGTRADLF